MRPNHARAGGAANEQVRQRSEGSKAPRSVETKVLSGFVAALLVLFVAGGFGYRTNAQFADTAEWVIHTQAVRAALNRLYATISDAETAQRNYLLTGNADHKSDYTSRVALLTGAEQHLLHLVADNPVQLQTYAELQPYIVQRMTALAAHVLVFDNRDMAAVTAAIGRDEGIRAKREIQALIERMDHAEKGLLEDRQAALELTRYRTLIALMASLAIATAFLTILYFGIRREIAARAAADQALLAALEGADAANRAKSAFLATMSHEIRTPMNGVLGMLELLSLMQLDAEQRTTLEIVRQSSKSLLRIIDDILDFSKIEAGKLDLRNEVASIKDVIEDVHNIYSGNASAKGLLIKRTADPKISPALLFDPLRLRQILNNFVSNALKFTSEGSIEIKAELIGRANAEDLVCFSVTDTGAGISADIQRQLFQPFSQGDSGQSQRIEGTGLGLTICRRLAEMMGGSVEMVSELGKGTRMTLSVSLAIADPRDLPTLDLPGTLHVLNNAAGRRRAAPSVARAETEGTLVLLVDDHPTNRKLLCRQVDALGYAAESARDGVEAFGKWKSGRFAIIITDCNMPEMDGYELTRRIRAEESASGMKRIPILACTANALVGEARTWCDAGMDDYIVKPVELPQILKKLEQWLPIPITLADAPNDAIQTLDHPPIDRSALHALSGGDETTEREMLGDFRRVNNDDAAVLQRAVADSDSPRVTRATHRILGASRMVGALGLSRICERIESAGRVRDWATVGVAMEAFHREWMRLNVYFDSIGALVPDTKGLVC